MKRELDKEIQETMRNNPSNWKGVFYYNPKDPRLMVPKLNPSMGWTLNFASPYSYLFLIALLVIIIASRYLK